MKKNIFIIILIFISKSLLSQNVDTTIIKIKNRKIIVLNEKISDTNDTLSSHHSFFYNVNEAHWAGIGIGVNYFTNSQLTTNFTEINIKNSSGGQKFLEILPEKSFEVQLNFAEKNFSIYKNHISLTTGLGLQFNNYRFKNNYRLNSDLQTISADLDTINTFLKSKLTVSYLTLPLLLEFRFPNKYNDKNIFLSFGVVGQLRLGSHTKYVYNINGCKTKDKNRDRFHINPFNYNYIATIGYDDISFYAKYSYSSFFINNEGPKIYTISFGIIFNM